MILLLSMLFITDSKKAVLPELECPITKQLKTNLLC